MADQMRGRRFGTAAGLRPCHRAFRLRAAAADRHHPRRHLITLNRYVQEPTPDLVLVGSSVAWRLKEEYFSQPRVRNLALAGGSPVTSLDIVAKQKSLPKIVLIETNVLTRLADDALIAKFSGGARTEALFLRPVRTAVAAYETWNHTPPSAADARARAGSPAQRAPEPIRQPGLSRPCRAADERR